MRPPQQLRCADGVTSGVFSCYSGSRKEGVLLFHNLKYRVFFGALISALSEACCAVLGRIPPWIWFLSMLEFGCRSFVCCCWFLLCFRRDAVGGFSRVCVCRAAYQEVGTVFLASWWFLASGLVKRHWPGPCRLLTLSSLSARPMPQPPLEPSPRPAPVIDLELGLECYLSMLESLISPLDLDTWRAQCSVKVPTLACAPTKGLCCFSVTKQGLMLPVPGPWFPGSGGVSCQ